MEFQNVSIEIMMDIIQSDTFNPRFYTHSRSMYDSKKKYEIEFNNQDGWKIQPIGEIEWQGFTKLTVYNVFNSLQCSIDEFAQDLYENVALKMVYHKIQFDELSSILGQNATKKAIDDMDGFKKSLQKALNSILKDINKPKLELV